MKNKKFYNNATTKQKHFLILSVIVFVIMFCVALLLTTVNNGFKVFASQESHDVHKNLTAKQYETNEDILFFGTENFHSNLTGGLANGVLNLPESLGDEVPYADITIKDKSLYDALINIYNETYKNHEGFEELKSVYINMFVNFIKLDLSNKSIYFVDGLDILEMPNLKELNLSQNRIININQALTPLTTLEKLDLFDNNITSLDLRFSNNLTNVDASFNNIKLANLSTIKSGEVLLNVNNLTTIQNIVFANFEDITNLTIELLNNNITDADFHFEQSNLTLELGLQGQGNNNQKDLSKVNELTVQTKHDFKFYNLHNNLAQVLVYNDQNVLVMKLENNLENKIKTFNLPIGKYSFKYVNSNSQQEIFDKTDIDSFKTNIKFKSYEFLTVTPSTPNVVFVVNGVEIANYSQNIKSGTYLKVSSYDTLSKQYYKFSNSNEWKEVLDGKISLENAGRYSVLVKSIVTIEGIEFTSETVVVTVFSAKQFNLWSGLLIVLMITLLFVGFVVFYPIVKQTIEHRPKKEKRKTKQKKQGKIETKIVEQVNKIKEKQQLKKLEKNKDKKQITTIKKDK